MPFINQCIVLFFGILGDILTQPILSFFLYVMAFCTILHLIRTMMQGAKPGKGG